MAAGTGRGRGLLAHPEGCPGRIARSHAPVPLPRRDGGEGCPAVRRPEAAGGHGPGSGTEPTCPHPGRSHQCSGCRERVPGELWVAGDAGVGSISGAPRAPPPSGQAWEGLGNGTGALPDFSFLDCSVPVFRTGS